MWNYPRCQTLFAPIFNWCTNPCASSMKNDLSANILNTKYIFFFNSRNCWNYHGVLHVIFCFWKPNLPKINFFLSAGWDLYIILLSAIMPRNTMIFTWWYCANWNVSHMIFIKNKIYKFHSEINLTEMLCY